MAEVVLLPGKEEVMKDWIIVWRAATTGTHGVTTVRATNLEDALKSFYVTLTKAAVRITSIQEGQQ